MIRITNLHLQTKSKSILKIPDLTILKNQKIALLGTNGSGKTSFCNALLNFYNTKQAVEFDKEYTFGCVFQDNKYSSDVKIKEVISLYKNLYKEIDEKYYLELFNFLEIEEFLNSKFKTLSGGQQQRFKIFLNLMPKPQLFILDEAFSAIDKIWKEKIVSFLKKYFSKNECILIIIAHEKNSLEDLCERVVVLEKGEIIFDIDKKDKLFKELIARYTD